VFADGGTRGSKRRDRLKELTLPDIPEIAGKSEGRGADLRPEPGAFPGPGTARRLPLPHAQGRARDKGLIHKNIIMARTGDSDCQTNETGPFA